VSTILIVDDRADNLLMLRILLESKGYTVVEAVNGKEALDTALSMRVKPALIISDILMPVMDGFALCHAWMSREELMSIPFVFYTASYTEDKDMDFGRTLGARRFFIKPIERSVLLNEIKVVLNENCENVVVQCDIESSGSSDFYKDYNQRLVLKLEDKLVQVEKQNQELMSKELMLQETRIALEQRISEREQVEKALRESEARLRTIFNNTLDAIVTYSAEGVVESFNIAAEVSFGYMVKEIIGKNIKSLVSKAHWNKINLYVSPSASAAMIKENNRLYEIEAQRKDGTLFPAEFGVSASHFGHTRIFTAIIRDITQRKQSEAAIYHMAYHDSLTGLVNRNEFERRSKLALENAKNRNVTHVLMYLDLDQFKIINDTCGHDAGDELLRQLAVQLSLKLRDRDTLARLGGDEFGILLENCLTEHAQKIAINLLKFIKLFRFVWQKKTFGVGASIGLATINPDSQSIGEVLSAADMACYTAKDLGRNRIHVYNESDSDLVQRQSEMQWISRINDALEERRFFIYQQPIVALNNEGSTSQYCELLIRMLGSNGKVIPTGAFIPAAERYNLMSTLDRYVISHAFSHLKSLKIDGKGKFFSKYFINLSGTSLNEETFFSFVQNQLRISKLPPELICFEITETAAITNLNKALNFIKKVKSMGCSFALDDFGTGLSSFSYLKTLPVDYLKIDGGFVCNMLDDSTDCAIVEAINQVGHATGKKIIAESVESMAIKQKLQLIGVDFAQGFGIQEPQLFLNIQQHALPSLAIS